MINLRNSNFSVASRNSLSQLSIGIALVSIIPILAFWHLNSIPGNVTPPQFWQLLVYLLIMFTGVTGYTILRRLPTKVTKLRSNMENVVSQQVSKPMETVSSESDIAAIEQYMGMIIGELREKIDDLEHEKRRVEQKLYQARKMECLGTMARGVSHDFNNLLAAILGNIDLVIRTLPSDSDSMHMATQIEHTARRALELTTCIQAYSGQAMLTIQQVNVSHLTEKALKNDGLKPPPGITLNTSFDPSVPEIPGDQAQITLAVKNLILNAYDAISDNKGTVSISTGKMKCDKEYLKKAYVNESLPGGDYVYIEVADTGCGLPAKVYSRMFDPFYTTKIRGNGLGLSMVIGILRAHNGTIKVESTEDGSVFRAVIPCERVV